MPQRQAEPIAVSEEEQAILEYIVRQPSSAQGLVMRARIILGAAAGESNRHMAAELKLTRNTVQLWRERWQQMSELRAAAAHAEKPAPALRQEIEATLSDAYRSGAPATFTAEQVVQIVAIACEDPQVSGYPISHWTPKDVAAEAIKRGIVDTISPRQVGRFLK